MISFATFNIPTRYRGLDLLPRVGTVFKIAPAMTLDVMEFGRSESTSTVEY
jgi:hypothetical protein